MSSSVCPSVSVHNKISKEGKIFNPKILMVETKITFFGWKFEVWRISKAVWTSKPVGTSLSGNRQQVPCTENGNA